MKFLSIFACTLVFLVIFLTLNGVTSRKMWGARKKREAEEEEIDFLPPQPSHVKRASGGSASSFNNRAKNDAGLSSAAVETALNTLSGYFDLVESALDSDEFIKNYDVDTFRTMLSAMDQYLTPEMKNEIDLENPESLRLIAKQGFGLAKQSMQQLIDVAKDPEQLSQLLDSFPPEITQLMNALTSGDTEAIKGLIDLIPGVPEKQKNVMSDLLAGNSEGVDSYMHEVQSQIQSVFSDPQQIELARQQMLENPAMAQAFGLSEEILNDPEQWAALVSEGMGALTGEEEQPSSKGRLSARARAA